MGDMEILQEAVEDTFTAENCFPGVATDEITDPERDDHELVEEFLARAGLKRQKIGEGISEKYGKHGDGGGDSNGAKKDLYIEWIFEECDVILEIPVMDDDAFADGPEAVKEHQNIGKQQKKCDPENGRERDEEFVGAGVHQRP